jgi:TetR/AcrR family transcriptional repressor of nem operon
MHSPDLVEFTADLHYLTTIIDGGCRKSSALYESRRANARGVLCPFRFEGRTEGGRRCLWPKGLAKRVQRSNSEKSKESYCDRYLSRWHQDNPGQGCTAAALAQELARSTPDLKATFEQVLENILSAKRGDRKEVIFQVAAMIGGGVLARAVQDHRLSDEILKSVRQKLG